MMRVRLAAIVGLCALTLAGCSTVQGIASVLNPFDNSDGDASLEGAAAPEARERIPLLALDQTLQVSESLAAVGFFLPGPTPVADWPLPGGNLEQSIEHAAAAPAFEVAWRRNVGRGTKRDQFITAPPIVAGGRIYTLDAQAGLASTDAASGSQIWRVDLNPRIRRDGKGYGGGIAFANGKVFVASGYRFVAAVDAASGSVLWKANVGTPIHSAPTVSGDRVFVVTTDNTLLTFDAATGEPEWQYQALVEPARILQASSPAISGETIVSGFSSGELVALRTTNGNELWSSSLTRTARTTALSEIRDIAGRPVIFRGDVFAGSHSGVFAAVDFRTGEVRWDLPVITTATPWAAGDVVYIVSKAGEVICVGRESGQIYWIRDLNEGRSQVRKNELFGFERRNRSFWTGVILASNRLIAASDDGRLVAIDPKTGEVQSYLNIGRPASLTPVVAGNMVYVFTEAGDIVAVR